MINDGPCLVNGKTSWTKCEKLADDDLSDCEEACTAHEPCVGYFFDYLCYLIPSNHSCPTGYYLSISTIRGSTKINIAATINDIEASPYEQDLVYGGVCYAKNLGNIVRAN